MAVETLGLQSKARKFRSVATPVVVLLGLLQAGMGAYAAGEIIDCPLRDAAYSVDTPMLDLMVNPAVKVLLENQLPAFMKNIPPMFLATEAPSLSAIMTLRGAADLLRQPMGEEQIEQLNAALAGVEITAADRQARCARYDNDDPGLTLTDADVQVLVFDKVNGFDHGEGTAAASAAVRAIAKEKGWGVSVTNKGGVFTPQTLQHFDLVIWNNVSGDVLTLSQRRAFEGYINQGGGFLGIHGSGGDFIYLWDWYVDELLGAQFIGHTMNPHYQDAKVDIEQDANGIGRGLQSAWTINDEWYSFAQNPRDKGAVIVATIDESTYAPEMGGISLRMGDDHPIAWARCVGEGRAFYTAIGHLPAVYQVPQNLALLANAMTWASGLGESACTGR